MEIVVEKLIIEDDAPILVTDGLHCGVEPIGGDIIDLLEREPVEGVITRRMYPEAVAAGRRYLSSGELGGKFDLNVLRVKERDEYDDDERAAMNFIAECPDQYWLGIDPHTANNPNADCLIVGGRASMKMIGVAGALGLRNVLVASNYPFYEVFSRFASVETHLAPGINPLSDPRVWRRHLETMAKLGAAGMADLGREIKDDLNYFVELDLMRLDSSGRVSEKACSLIEKLEDIEQPDEYFTPIKGLPDFLTRRIPPGRTIYAGHWDDRNNSPELPELLGYRQDGRPRRACFGSFLLKIAPPKLAAA